jgi:type I restriction enzyme S subunit
LSDDKENNLPIGWERTTLGRIVLTSSSKVNPQDYPTLPYVGLEQVEAHTTKILETVPAITMKSAAVRFYAGDVLYGRLRPYLNKVCCPDFDGLGSSEFIVFSSHRFIDSNYLKYLLNSRGFVSFVSQLNTGDRPRVDFLQISEYKFSLAPLNEQRRIVAEIEKQVARLEEGITALKRTAEDLRLYRASVLKAACEGHLVLTEAALARREKRAYEPASMLLQRTLEQRRARWEREQRAKMKARGRRPKDDKWKEKYVEPEAPSVSYYQSELSEGWTIAGFEQLASFDKNAIKAGPFGSKLKKDFYTSSGYKIYGQEQVIRGDAFYGDYYIDGKLYQELISCAVKPGDLLISLVGTTGKVLILPKGIEPGIINPRLLKLTLNPKIVDTHYTKIYLESPLVKGYMQLVSHGGTMDILNLTILKDLPVPLPPLAEQKRIIAEVESRLRAVEETEAAVAANLARAEELRRSILQRAFEGWLVSQDPTDEPASRLLERIAAERLRKEEAMKEKKRKPRRPSRAQKMPGLFQTEPKDIHRALLREGQILSVEEAFKGGGFSYAPDESGEFADVDTFFEQLSVLLTRNDVELQRHPEAVMLISHAPRLPRGRLRTQR